MRIEEQVCTLQQAKRLKELGVNNESMFAYWTDNEDKISRLKASKNPDTILYSIDSEVDDDFSVILRNSDEFIRAYTVAELGEMLKDWNNSHQHNDNLMPRYYCDGIVDWWHCDHYWIGMITSPNEAIARAALLIHLLENNPNPMHHHTTLAQLNEARNTTRTQMRIVKAIPSNAEVKAHQEHLYNTLGEALTGYETLIKIMERYENR